MCGGVARPREIDGHWRTRFSRTGSEACQGSAAASLVLNQNTAEMSAQQDVYSFTVQVDDGVVVVTLFILAQLFLHAQQPEGSWAGAWTCSCRIGFGGACPQLNKSNACEYDASAAV
jgi:hypothetical protein